MTDIPNMPLTEFIASAGITMTCKRTDDNPGMDDLGGMDHWRCTLRAGRSRMTLTFSMGSAHNGKEPTVEDVLDCLASDASGYANASEFDLWCQEYGYDGDSRKAERTFKAVRSQTQKLMQFLGESAFETLLWKTERL